jgi:hypothetical protein
VPELRKRHAIINYDGRICIFGGLSGNKFYNDFHSFCYYSNMWRPVLKENNTVLPPPRVPFVLLKSVMEISYFLEELMKQDFLAMLIY